MNNLLPDNPRAVTGDNAPPDYAREVTERMARDYAETVRTVTELLDDARRRGIESIEPSRKSSSRFFGSLLFDRSNTKRPACAESCVVSLFDWQRTKNRWTPDLNGRRGASLYSRNCTSTVTQ